MKKWMIALTLMLTLTACSVFGPPSLDPSRDISAGCRWKYTGDQDYEATTPGGGKSSSYDCFLGHANIYRYSLGKHDWRADSPDFPQLAKATAADIVAHYEKEGTTVTAFRLGATDTGVINIHGRAFQGYRFDISKGNGPQEASYMLITAEAGELLKYRVTFTLPRSAGQAAILLNLVAASLPAAAPAPVASQ